MPKDPSSGEPGIQALDDSEGARLALELTEEEALEDVVDLVDTGLRYLDARLRIGETARAIPDAALEELVAALSQAPLFNGVSPEGVRILAAKARRIKVAPFQTLIDAENPEEGLLEVHGLLIATEDLILDLSWLQNLAPGQHLGEGGWVGEERMATVSTQEEGSALVIDSALVELGLSPEDQLQIGFNALCNSALAGDNTKLVESIPDELLRVESDKSFEQMASESAERLGLKIFAANVGEPIVPKAGHVFLGIEGTVNIHATGSENLLGQIQFPNLCFEVNGAGGKATAKITAHTAVKGYWLPLAAEGNLKIEDRLALLQQVRRSHNIKLSIANQQVRGSVRAEETSPEEGPLAGILNFFKRLTT